MTIALSFFCFLSVSLSFGLYFSLKKNLELLQTIEDANEALENSLEEINFYSRRIEKKAKLEVFSDDPVIKELIEDIKNVKNLVSQITKNFTENDPS